MKKFFNLISLLLAVFTLVGVFAITFSINVFAVEDTTNETENTEENLPDLEIEAVDGSIDYLTHYFASPEEKLAAMGKPAYEKGDIRLYVDKVSGEVAYVNMATGEKLFTNPYDVASSTGNEATKYEILSQIIVTFTDNKGQERVFNSYEEAAERGQITVENIKNGIRVEYAIGREQSKILVPRLISMERFQEMILDPLYEVFGDELYNPRSTDPAVFDIQKMLSYFIFYAVDSADDLGVSKKDKANMDNTFGGVYFDLANYEAQYARTLKKFPIIENMPVFVFDPDASESELSHAESIILKYCPDYTYEELEYDHILTEYKADDANPPVFRLALEYKVAEDGLSVRLPANGIRFNESLYTLDNIEVLPYMGAGNSAYEGYNFFPDGSGALFDFQALNGGQTRAVSGNVYGTDFAYHEISGTYQKTIRYPVFGIVETAKYYTYKQYNDDLDTVIRRKKIAGNIVEAIEANRNGESVDFCKGQEATLAEKYDMAYISAPFTTNPEIIEEKHGFVCIIEEGDALAAITTYHAGALSDYNTIRMQFTPRPKDSYVISDSISVGSNDEWTVVSDRKYVGNYMMKYITLSSASNMEESVTTYDASWFGMAVAYRDYLTNKGIISKLDSNRLASTEDIPLYIETFGAIETTEKILSIPVTVMAPLTTFEDIKTMYTQLSTGDPENGINGIKNINFKLTGYANGGMQYTMPGNLKFEKAVGGNDGFQALLDYANSVNKKEDGNLGVYPDFDFAYTANDELFDGHTALTHNAKTIDDRYASKRVYSATQQKYENFYEMAISPAYFAEFYNKLKKNYADKYTGEMGISVSTLGNALNSDFDEDEPYNREDSKEFTIEAFKHFKNTYGSVMTDGGNAYVWKYVDHMLGVSLDSSRYNFASESVPFIGVVLHGSIQFAGEPLNMEGDLRYAMLKAIENGASPYFILAYQNTEVLKEDEQLSKYYSIQYKIWKDDIISTYNELNSVLGDVQDKYIIGHTPIYGATRVPDYEEFAQDIIDKYAETLNNLENATEILELELKMAAYYARKDGRDAEKEAAEAVLEVLDYYVKQINYINSSSVHGADYYDNLKAAFTELRAVTKFSESDNADEVAAYDRIYKIYDLIQMYNYKLEECKKDYDNAMESLDDYLAYEEYIDYKTLVNGIYKDYSSGKISSDQIDKAMAIKIAEKLMDEAIEGYDYGEISREELKDAIKKYGVALLNTTTLDDAVKYYLNGELDNQVLINAATNLYKNKNGANKAKYYVEFEDTLEAYMNGTLADTALDSAVQDWFAEQETATYAELEEAIDVFTKGYTSQSDLEYVIGAYMFGQIKDTVQVKIEKLKTTKAAYDKSVLEPITDAAAYEEAKATYATAKKTFDDDVAKFLDGMYNNKVNITASNFVNALNTFDPEKNTYDEWVLRENIGNTNAGESNADLIKAGYDEAKKAAIEFCFGNGDYSHLNDLVEDYLEKTEKYNEYLAACKAFDAVCDSGFKLEFADCFNIYKNKYVKDCYEPYKNIIKSGKSSVDDEKYFKEYYSADVAVSNLESKVRSLNVKTGTFDKYVIALAEYDYYDANRENENEDDIQSAKDTLESRRRSAISGAASVQSKEYEKIQKIYDEVYALVGKADGAIEAILDAENDKREDKYVLKIDPQKAEEKYLFLKIEIEDDMPNLVKEAIERAKNAYYSIEEDRYSVIDEQRYETNETYEGNKLYRVTLPKSGNTVYSYGTYETGYQYLVKNADGTFSPYSDQLDENGKTGYKSFAGGYVNGVMVYEDSFGDFGKDVYFTIVDGKYTYYTKVSEGVFVEKDAITYEAETDENGEKIVFSTRIDGTEIYRDGDVYFSENADGTYVRYTFTKCIATCYEELYGEGDKVGLNEQFFGRIEALQNHATASDNDIFKKVQDRIKVNASISKPEDNDNKDDNTESKYSTENIIVVTYGNDDGSAYKTLILNYNNYSVKVEYDGKVYTIPAYYYVEHN